MTTQPGPTMEEVLRLVWDYGDAVHFYGNQGIQLAHKMDAVTSVLGALFAALDAKGWIKCSERMPPENQYVLVYYCGGNWHDRKDDPNRMVMKLRRRNVDMCGGETAFQWQEFGAFGCIQSLVSHWMPLPAAPEPQEEP